MKYGPFTTLNIPKCERFTLLEFPLRFLGISVVRRMKTKLRDSEQSRIVWILQEFYSIWNNKINNISKQQNLTKNKRPKHII